jgi:hypothetical protein
VENCPKFCDIDSPPPSQCQVPISTIGTKWAFINKLNEDGNIVINKERFVCKGYAQVEGIEFEEIFAHVARLEAIRFFLAFASFKNFKVY